MAAANDVWHAHFPRLHRRAQWHIVLHLCTRGRDGASVGELYGLVKQVFLLDDATVKDRIGEIATLGLCALDPPDGRIAARTVVIPAPALLEQFDAHLQAVAAELREAVADIDPHGPPPSRVMPAVPLSVEQRQLVLQALSVCGEAWLTALERIFEERNLSKARRLEAKRNLISTSHRSLLHMAVAYHYGLPPRGDSDDGILADHMAASLLQLTGQNFQTTRDHIAHLMELGLLERRRGRSLHVALAAAAATELHVALESAASSLPGLSRALDATLPAPLPGGADPYGRHDGPAEERTLMSRPPEEPADPWLRELVVVEPPNDKRRVLLTDEPLTIGRQMPSGLLLNASEISRTHCQVRLVGDLLTVTDLRSTNGTFVDGKRIAGSLGMRVGSTLQMGPYVLVYERAARTPEALSDSTMRAAASTSRHIATRKTPVSS